MRLARVLSLGCSVALLPVLVFAGWEPFLALAIFNFILFHAIWLLPLIKGLKLTHQFIKTEIRLPLILFMVCGNAGLLAHVAGAIS